MTQPGVTAAKLWNSLPINQPRSRSSSAISDVTSPVKFVGKIRLGRPRAIALGSKPPLVTRIARTGLGTRLPINIRSSTSINAFKQTFFNFIKEGYAGHGLDSFSIS